MIPIVLITGFLGSGKTTLLSRLARDYRGRRLAWLVNEFSKADVDGPLVEEWVGPGELRVIPGGSIFCTCLVTEFMSALAAIPEKLPDVEGVVIEASGVANPMSVEKLIKETQLDGKFRLATVVCVVDPFTLPVLVHTLPNIAAQIEAADLVVLNKTDLATEEQIEAAEAGVRRIRPDVRVRRASYGAIDDDLFAPHTPRGLETDYAPCVDPRYAELRVKPAGPVDVDAVRAELEGFGPDLYRAKGYLDTADGRVLLDYVSGITNIRPVGPSLGDPGLTLIVRGAALARAYALADRLRDAVRAKSS